MGCEGVNLLADEIEEGGLLSAEPSMGPWLKLVVGGK